MGKRAAPVDIRHQQTSGIGGDCYPHVDNIVGFEVDLSGRACAFNNDHVILGHQLVQRFLNRRPDALAAVAPRGMGQFVVDLPEQNDLAVGVALGFEQQRVHADFGDGVGGERLKILRTADLAAVDNPCVVAHVLRFEGRDFQA